MRDKLLAKVLESTKTNMESTKTNMAESWRRVALADLNEVESPNQLLESKPTRIAEQLPDRRESSWPPAEAITDDLQIERQVFRVSETTSVIFRGQEELPDFGQDLEAYGTRQLLTPEPRPIYTNTEDYQNWCQQHETGSAQPGRDCLIASATPLGVVDVALKLTEKGLAPGQIGRLNQLRAKLCDGVIDGEVSRLYDSLFAAATIRTEDDSRERGLMELAFCLADDPAATETITAKLAERQLKDRQKWAEVYGGVPGRRPTPEQLERLRQQRLVAVHTTPTRPEGRILPTAAYNQQDKDHVPRVTVHTSLNHPVGSHMWGNFENNNYTVISLLAEMADLNGVPDVLNPVDTYFTVGQTSGLELPAETIVVETGLDQTDFVKVDQCQIKVRTGPVLAAELAELATVSQQIDPSGAETATSNQVFAQMVRNVDKLIRIELNSLLDGQKVLSDESRRVVAELRQLYQQTVDSDDPRYHQTPANSRNLTRRLLTHYTELDHEAAADYPAVTQALQESVRQFLVRQSISRLGGMNVEAGAHYSFDDNFNREVMETAQKLGLRRSLHQHQPEAFFENWAFLHKQDVFAPPQPALGADLDELDLYRQQAKRVGDRQNLDGLWGSLEELRPEWRQAAIRGDFLTYASPPTEPSTPESLLYSFG